MADCDHARQGLAEDFAHFLAPEIVAGEIKQTQPVVGYGTTLQEVVTDFGVSGEDGPLFSGYGWNPECIVNATLKVIEMLFEADTRCEECVMEVPISRVILV